MSRRITCFVAFGVLAGVAGAQSFNIEFEGSTGNGPPSDAYGAAGQAGRWNQFSGFSHTNAAMADLAGNATAATMTFSVIANGSNFVPSWTGEDQKLMEDFLIAYPNDQRTVSLDGLLNGSYRVRLYGMVYNYFGQTAGAIWTIGGNDYSTSPSGDWPGAHQLGYTYAMTDVTVTNGELDVAFKGYFAGMQLEYGPQSVPEPFTMALMGGAAVAGYRRMRRRKA